MASARQIAANKRNASLPRGPLSETAAAAIRENAQKHGLTAKHVVLRHESYTDYQELRASIVMEYQPATPQEQRLADQIAQNYWRLLRCRRVETATFENRLDTLKDRLKIDPASPIDDDQGVSICMSNDARDFDTIRRYETTIERAWYRAIRELRTMQAQRRKEDTQICTNKPSVEEVFENGIRCVSQQPQTTQSAAAQLSAFDTNKPNLGVLTIRPPA